MAKINEVCLLNDSFPPLIDGVTNAVVNYARVIKNSGYGVSVVVPDIDNKDDSVFDYPVIRYPSIDLRNKIGYTVGNPFNIPALLEISKRNISLLHSHCPAMSNMVARTLRDSLDVPLVMTYHTKFDIDIANAIKSKSVQQLTINALIDSVDACDELWVVSEGAGQNLRKLGYTGDYVVMRNGVDMPKSTASKEQLDKINKEYNLKDDIPTFLFVGRLMWYKGLRIILDALAALKSQDFDFRMIFIGAGGDEVEVKEYVNELKLNDKVIFTGAISDRNELVTFYSRADLLLFPSTFDTNGLVVREAAACNLGSVLVKDSCAAEGVTNNIDGLLIEENAASLAVCLAKIINNKQAMKKIGENASNNLYYSWDDSIKNAIKRYEIVIDNYNKGLKQNRKKLSDEIFSLSSNLVDMLSEMEERKKKIEEKIDRYL
jgi:1,2-diacylglycerol 3-alpha-glucosyltransferase